MMRPIHPSRLPAGMAALALSAALSACGGSAQLSVDEGTGPDPRLPAPEQALLPVINVAPAIGWAHGARPTAAPGLDVRAYADGLEHPRWLYVLPNGDVLVA